MNTGANCCPVVPNITILERIPTACWASETRSQRHEQAPQSRPYLRVSTMVNYRLAAPDLVQGMPASRLDGSGVRGCRSEWRQGPRRSAALTACQTTRRRFDVIAAWSVDRGRSLQTLRLLRGARRRGEPVLHQRAVTDYSSGAGAIPDAGRFGSGQAMIGSRSVASRPHGQGASGRSKSGRVLAN
jgi:hypothetical protein